MLRGLSPKEFEEWCKVLLERYFECPVEVTPHVADEGRDLIVDHHKGPIVVECKHYRGNVGRQPVQKLHSATITGRGWKGMLLTSGGFTDTAHEYVEQVELPIDLVDKSNLSHMAAEVGLPVDASDTASGLAHSYPVLPPAAFETLFPKYLLAGDRYQPGTQEAPELRILRGIEYKGRFIAEYDAYGDRDTAVGTATERWSGLVLCDAHGKDVRLAQPREGKNPFEALVTLTQALKIAPGGAEPPGIQPQKAEKMMKRWLLGNLQTTVTYTGRNNQTYTKPITPNAKQTNIRHVRLIYDPIQSFELNLGSTTHTGYTKDEDGRFLVRSRSLSSCTVCQREVNAQEQVICAACYKPTHQRSFLYPDSHECSECGAVVCWRDSRHLNGEVACISCAGEEAKRPWRTKAHVLLGAGATALYAALIFFVPEAIGVGVLLLLAWIPLLFVLKKGSGEGIEEWLRYGPPAGSSRDDLDRIKDEALESLEVDASQDGILNS